MQEDKFWFLVSLKLSGEASTAEIDELNAILQSRPEMGLQLDILQNIWQQRHQKGLTNKDELFNKHLQRLSNHLSEPSLKYESDETGVRNEPVAMISGSHSRNRWWWLAASAAASVIVFSLFFYPQTGPQKSIPIPAQNTVSTKPGSKSKIQLPDGTQVWLNADSRITYHENFMDGVREVELTGEAYFDVVQVVSPKTGKKAAFVIHTQAIDVKVLGTAFNVRSYANEKTTETSLLRGSVEITLRNNPDKKIILKPNEKLSVQNNDFLIQQKGPVPAKNEQDQPLMILSKVHFQQKDNSPIETLWVKNRLAFDTESLESIALKMERWFDVKVVITDDKLKSHTYSAVFDGENLQQVMEALRIVGNFKYEINKKEVIINR